MPTWLGMTRPIVRQRRTRQSGPAHLPKRKTCFIPMAEARGFRKSSSVKQKYGTEIMANWESFLLGHIKYQMFVGHKIHQEFNKQLDYLEKIGHIEHNGNLDRIELWYQKRRTALEQSGDDQKLENDLQKYQDEIKNELKRNEDKRKPYENVRFVSPNCPLCL